MMSTEAIIGMVICLAITFGGFLGFLIKALRMDKHHPEKEK